MDKKYLIVSGCSWTDPHQYSEDPKVSNDIVKNYYRWPNILADKLNMKLINFGKYASGNEYICSSLIDNILAMSEDERSNIGLVIAAWSEAKRTDFEFKKNDNDYYVKNLFENKYKEYRYNKKYIWDSVLYTDPLRGDMFYRVKQSIRYMYMLQTFLKHNNIPYKMVQSVPLEKLPNLGTEFNLGLAFGTSQRSLQGAKEVEDIFKQQVADELSQFPIYNLIDKNNFISWPILNSSLYKKLDRAKDFISNLNVKTDGRQDNHPNQSGHNKISNIILNNINNTL
tara:strand:+ start:899 stop:1747 length:849 start_codon:yes stop_codon:yes gene_type:complete